MAETMTPERALEVMASLADDHGRSIRAYESPSQTKDREDKAAALRLALARLAALDAAREALAPVVAAIRTCEAAGMRLPYSVELSSAQCLNLLAAYAQLGEPTDAADPR